MTAMLTRSLFFAPANRPELLEKFPRIPADCFVIDLEDGTPPADKVEARQRLPERIDKLRTAAPNLRLFVRTNNTQTEFYEEDLRVAASCSVDGIVLPKIEKTDDVRRAADSLERRGRPPAVIGGIESMMGLLRVEALAEAACGLVAVYFGAEDLASEMQARRTPAGLEVLYGRSRAVLAARAFDIEPIDQAVLEVRDDARFTVDANFGRDLGYGGKICLLPRQVTLAHRAFSPTEEEINRAERIVSGYEEAMRRGHGTVDLDGQMIDGPLLKRARRILDVAAQVGSGSA
jgi:citrate lyase subunit beta / citryl-CoA lyase